MAGIVARPSRSLFARWSVLLAAVAATLPLAWPAPLHAAPPPEPPHTRHKLAGLDVDVVGDLRGFTVKLGAQSLEPNLDVVTVTLESPTRQRPPAFALKWAVPSHDVAGQWTPSRILDKGIKPDWARSRLEVSMFAKNAPVVALFGADNGNVQTFAVSDALNTLSSGSGVREEDGLIYNEVAFFGEPHVPLTTYTAQLRIDRRRVPYFTALGDVGRWWAQLPGMQPASVPPDARLPMYSTWYNYHQKLDPKELLAELAVAKELGFRTIIVDDGWQTLDSSRGYAYTGDWKPERMPDMKGFVDACHKLGIKVMLWYAVPFMGTNAAGAAKWKGKTLRLEERMGAYVLDPRYPDVRAYVIDIYRKALTDFGLDGFKLDFIERFVADDKTVLEAKDGRDYASVNEATDRMMTDVLLELRKSRPDVLIEFRQPYIGPLIRKYGNMFRAGDCPNSYLANRVKTIDLRLLSGQTAVHADMIMWHPGEPVEAAARQLLHILFSVPQVSVRLREIPAEHREMLTYYTRYWTENRAVLLDGKLEPLYPAQNYPVVIGSSGRKQIVGLYGDGVVPLDAARPSQAIDVVNGTAASSVVLMVSGRAPFGSYRYVVRDCRGRTVGQGKLRLGPGAHAVAVPPSGLLALERTGN
jgi:alpha-galactosidase